jgi:hypothetical protein
MGRLLTHLSEFYVSHCSKFVQKFQNSQLRLRTVSDKAFCRSVAIFSVVPVNSTAVTLCVTSQRVFIFVSFKFDLQFPNDWFEGSRNSPEVLFQTLKKCIGNAWNTRDSFQWQRHWQSADCVMLLWIQTWKKFGWRFERTYRPFTDCTEEDVDRVDKIVNKSDEIPFRSSLTDIFVQKRRGFRMSTSILISSRSDELWGALTMLFTVVFLPTFSTLLKISGMRRLSLNFPLGASDHPYCRDSSTAMM